MVYVCGDSEVWLLSELLVCIAFVWPQSFAENTNFYQLSYCLDRRFSCRGQMALDAPSPLRQDLPL